MSPGEHCEIVTTPCWVAHKERKKVRQREREIRREREK